MELFKFISEVLNSTVEALEKSSKGLDEEAKAQLRTIARKILGELPGPGEESAPGPGQQQR